MRIRVACLIMLSLTLAWPLGADVKTDIEYGRAGGERLLLDAFVPPGDGPFPAVIWIHGGGFTRGDKQPYPASLLDSLVDEGFSWFSVNYRLAPAHPFPAAVDDVEQAVRYVKIHAQLYNVDPDRLVLMGASAGGLIVSVAGARQRGANQVAAVVPFFGEHDLVSRVQPEGDCMIDGKVVPDPGPYCLSPGLAAFLGVNEIRPEIMELLRKASAVSYARPDMPPYLLIHGTLDIHVPYDQSVLMCEAMKKVGAPCELVPVEGGGHGFGAWDKGPAMSAYKARMIRWLKQHLLAQSASPKN